MVRIHMGNSPLAGRSTHRNLSSAMNSIFLNHVVVEAEHLDDDDGSRPVETARMSGARQRKAVCAKNRPLPSAGRHVQKNMVNERSPVTNLRLGRLRNISKMYWRLKTYENILNHWQIESALTVEWCVCGRHCGHAQVQGQQVQTHR